MKLKYYLRGLGMGIIVTVLILMIFYGVKGRMSDEDVIARAEKLGMVMKETGDDVLFPEESSAEKTAAGTAAETVSETPSEEITDEETTEEETEPETEAQTEAPTGPETEAPTEPQTEAPTEPAVQEPQNDVYTLTIVSGMYSEAVSARLAEAGMVASAEDFNNYLENNGYAERLKTGVYYISKGMSYGDIAVMIIQ